MKKTVCLCGLAFTITMIAILSCICSVLAYEDCDDVWGNYARAKVCGTYPTPITKPYYAVYHDAWIYENLKGRCCFTGWDNVQRTSVKYSVWRYLGVWGGHVYPPHQQYNPPYYNQIWHAQTETWGNIGSIHQEKVTAVIGPPGMQ